MAERLSTNTHNLYLHEKEPRDYFSRLFLVLHKPLKTYPKQRLRLWQIVDPASIKTFVPDATRYRTVCLKLTHLTQKLQANFLNGFAARRRFFCAHPTTSHAEAYSSGEKFVSCLHRYTAPSVQIIYSPVL